MSKQVEGMGEATLAAAEMGAGARWRLARADTGMSVRTLLAPQKAYSRASTSAQGCTGRGGSIAEVTVLSLRRRRRRLRSSCAALVSLTSLTGAM